MYFEPIRQYMPPNCSADVQVTIAHVDQVLTTGTMDEQQSLKELFGLQELRYNDDVAGALRWSLWEWQFIKVASPV